MRSHTLTFAAVVLILSVYSLLYGQTDRGTIVGTITDQAGATIAGAQITVTNLENSEVRKVTSSHDGTFTVPQLKAAPYKIAR